MASLAPKRATPIGFVLNTSANISQHADEPDGAGADAACGHADVFEVYSESEDGARETIVLGAVAAPTVSSSSPRRAAAGLSNSSGANADMLKPGDVETGPTDAAGQGTRASSSMLGGADQDASDAVEERPEGATLAAVCFNLANTIVGAGIIGLAFALAEAGFVLGIVLLVVVAWATDYSLGILIVCGCVRVRVRVAAWLGAGWLGVAVSGRCFSSLFFFISLCDGLIFGHELRESLASGPTCACAVV